MKAKSRRVFLLLAVGVGALFVLCLPTYLATTPTIRVGRYPSVIAKLKQTDSEAAHFPDQIPTSASSVTFFYLPHFMQGSSILRLRLKLPPGEVADLDRKFRAQHPPLTAKEVHRVSPYGIPSVGMQARFLSERVNEGFEPLPADFTSFLIGIDLETALKNWNHPHNGGISVSTSRNEVVYWVN